MFVKETTITINFPKYSRGFVGERSVTSGPISYPEFYFVGGINFHKYKRFCDEHPEINKFLRI